MKKYDFSILLKSDAEPACGTGGELLNSNLPKNEDGHHIIPASHLKGIMRENLFNILSPLRKDAADICGILFGVPGEISNGGRIGILHISNAVAENAKTLTVTRTKIDSDTGVAVPGSLRVTEALAKGTILKGVMNCNSKNEILQKFCRLALMTVVAIGGSRTRGCGECKITIPAFTTETPGKLLKELISAHVEKQETCIEHDAQATVDEKFKALKLIFETESSIYIPERPTGKSNVISSGNVIPGTAVAGVLLNLISEKDSKLSSGCFNSKVFRCMPLLPTPSEGDSEIVLQISNSHKISKLRHEPNNDYIFGDLMIPDKYLDDSHYRWQEKSKGIAMKGASGMLVVQNNGSVKLLRIGDIPRYYTAHGVVNGGEDKMDNLFTIESIKVKKFTSIVLVPTKVADLLLEILKEGRQVFFGKSKTTMGGGILKAETTPLFDNFEQCYHQVKNLKNRLFIVQSPIVYDAPPESSSRDIINKVLSEAGWGEVEEESVMTSILFGWNNMKLDKQLNNSGRVQAKRVITPGSVFLLKTELSQPVEKIALGLGSDRYAGYGAVMPHPMFATSIVELEKKNSDILHFSKCEKSPIIAGYKLHKQCGKKLSASQIAKLLSCAETSVEVAAKYLEDQRLYRPGLIWDSWESVKNKLDNYFKQYNHEDVLRMLRVWHDLNVGDK